MTAYEKFMNYLWENGISMEFINDMLNPRDKVFMDATLEFMKMFDADTSSGDIYYRAAVTTVERGLSNLEMLNSVYGM